MRLSVFTDWYFANLFLLGCASTFAHRILQTIVTCLSLSTLRRLLLINVVLFK